MTHQEIAAQHEVILSAARRLWPRCSKLKVMQYSEDESRWLVQDPESDLWWEASPGGGSRDASGYRRMDTVAFWPITWRDGRRTRRGGLAGELGDHGVPEDETAEMGDWGCAFP